MKLLLDTHIFLWYVAADPKLPETHRVAIQDSNNDVFLSVASVWEAVIKHGIGKLPLPGPPAEYLAQKRMDHRIGSLPIDEGAMSHLTSLAPLHRDPFDRILVAQGLQYGFTIATVDPLVLMYPVPVLPIV